MEFWGVEVKGGEPLRCESGDDFVVHLSQACLGEVKKDKGNESVYLYVKIGDKKLVLGTLSPEKFPQLSFDLIFDDVFELSHNWKDGSVYFTGYKVLQNDGEDESSEDFDIREGHLFAADNGKPELQDKQTKPVAEKPHATKPGSIVKIVEPNRDVKPDEETDDSSDKEDDSASDDESSDDQAMMANGEDDDEDDESDDEDDDSDDEDDESDDKDEETPKVEVGKKRSTEFATKTPVPDKKAKLVTPQKTDRKKVVEHVATPHPSKQAAKMPSNSDQKKEQTPKNFSCKSCNRSFGSEGALQSHTKAKHAIAK